MSARTLIEASADTIRVKTGAHSYRTVMWNDEDARCFLWLGPDPRYEFMLQAAANAPVERIGVDPATRFVWAQIDEMTHYDLRDELWNIAYMPHETEEIEEAAFASRPGWLDKLAHEIIRLTRALPGIDRSNIDEIKLRARNEQHIARLLPHDETAEDEVMKKVEQILAAEASNAARPLTPPPQVSRTKTTGDLTIPKEREKVKMIGVGQIVPILQGRIWPNEGVLAFWEAEDDVTPQHILQVKKVYSGPGGAFNWRASQYSSTALQKTLAFEDFRLQFGSDEGGYTGPRTVGKWLSGQHRSSGQEIDPETAAAHELHLRGGDVAGDRLKRAMRDPSAAGSMVAARYAGTQPVAAWRAKRSTSESEDFSEKARWKSEAGNINDGAYWLAPDGEVIDTSGDGHSVKAEEILANLADFNYSTGGEDEQGVMRDMEYNMMQRMYALRYRRVTVDTSSEPATVYVDGGRLTKDQQNVLLYHGIEYSTKIVHDQGGRAKTLYEPPEEPPMSESMARALVEAECSASDIHALANEKGIAWDNDPAFLAWSKKLTGEGHIDAMTPEQRATLCRAIRADQRPLAEAESTWPAKLDQRQLVDFIVELSTDEVDEELIWDNFQGVEAVLQTVDVDSLREGDPDAHIPDPRKERRYAKRNAATMPPIVVEDGEIVDGHHRWRVAKARGDKTILAYVIREL